ncbi:hypothetical protein M501DRAFT_1013999 [Patellaria atrata CBS 101060]|uniref:Uncharacterized protein n=1 Tax=Patellaria atrata CBS 101060 TaxID=1346257 RepID=A0A9P4VV21_9PEZI|nr:hypothetical protein M501DRAFT_1013999 [Patellaria atrata CBS 101060]
MASPQPPSTRPTDPDESTSLIDTLPIELRREIVTYLLPAELLYSGNEYHQRQRMYPAILRVSQRWHRISTSYLYGTLTPVFVTVCGKSLDGRFRAFDIPCWEVHAPTSIEYHQFEIQIRTPEYLEDPRLLPKSQFVFFAKDMPQFILWLRYLDRRYCRRPSGFSFDFLIRRTIHGVPKIAKQRGVFNPFTEICNPHQTFMFRGAFDLSLVKELSASMRGAVNVEDVAGSLSLPSVREVTDPDEDWDYVSLLRTLLALGNELDSKGQDTRACLLYVCITSVEINTWSNGHWDDLHNPPGTQIGNAAFPIRIAARYNIILYKVRHHLRINSDGLMNVAGSAFSATVRDILTRKNLAKMWYFDGLVSIHQRGQPADAFLSLEEAENVCRGTDEELSSDLVDQIVYAKSLVAQMITGPVGGWIQFSWGILDPSERLETFRAYCSGQIERMIALALEESMEI